MLFSIAPWKLNLMQISYRNFHLFTHLRQNQYKIILPFRIRWPRSDIAKNRNNSPYIKLEDTQTVTGPRGWLEETRRPPPVFFNVDFPNSRRKVRGGYVLEWVFNLLIMRASDISPHTNAKTPQTCYSLLDLQAWYRYDIIAVSDCCRLQTVQNWRYETGTICWVVRAASV